MYKTTELFDLSKTIAAPLLKEHTWPWQALNDLPAFIMAVGETLLPDRYDNPKPHVWIAKSATIFDSARIDGPCIIGEDAEVRHGAYIRADVIIGAGAVIGTASEIKNAILFDGVEVPHYNYVGDSVFGYKAHMGAGAVVSNLKSDRSEVVVKSDKQEIATGRRKVGAMLGDFAEVGCNAVLCPGSVVGKNTTIYPTSCVRGVIPEKSIFKNSQDIVKKR